MFENPTSAITEEKTAKGKDKQRMGIFDEMDAPTS
jgi:hypothetical protein